MGYIAIVDYGAGNLMSVHNTLDYLGYENKIAASADVIENAAGVILPGVGAFPDAMAALTDSGLTEAVLKAAKGKPFLGICLGLQLLFDSSEETPGVKGLGLLPGEILRIPAAEGLKIPHMGWNSIDIKEDSRLFEGIDRQSYMYFVHSYYLKARNPEDVAATTWYSTDIHAAVEHDNIFACQFHPEKSSELGLRILKNFADLRL